MTTRIVEAIEASDKNYNFPVELQDLYTQDGKISKRKAVVRTDKNNIISDVSSSYKLVDHQHIFKMAEEYVSIIGKPTVKYHVVNNGAKIVGEYTFKDVTSEVKKNDIVGLRLYVGNSYDGKSSVKLKVGGLRLICLNGMVGSANDFSISYRHSGDNIQNGRIVNMELPKPEEVLGSFKANFKYWNKLTELELSKGDIEFYQNRAVEDGVITGAVLTKGPDLEEPTAWGLYNTFTEYITHRERASASTLGKIARLGKVESWFRETFV